MANKKGQALVEFILLLPIILILIFSSIDLFNLYLQKNDLQSRLDNEIRLIRKKKETIEEFEEKFEKEGIDVTFKEDDTYLTIYLKKEADWISPITKLVLKDYRINIKRVIPFE